MLTTKSARELVSGSRASSKVEGVKMEAIKVLRGTIASGKHLDEGKMYKVPSEVSAEDAVTLVGLKKAVEVKSAKGGDGEKSAPKSGADKTVSGKKPAEKK